MFPTLFFQSLPISFKSFKIITTPMLKVSNIITIFMCNIHSWLIIIIQVTRKVSWITRYKFHNTTRQLLNNQGFMSRSRYILYFNINKWIVSLQNYWNPQSNSNNVMLQISKLLMQEFQDYKFKLRF
jgi:hypothetical protein